MEPDFKAPIIPLEGLGGIKLYSKLNDLKEELVLKDEDRYVGIKQIYYTVQEKIGLVFNAKNEKLMIIYAENGYEGKLYGKIGLGTLEEELLQLCPNFVYEEFEEIWVDYENCISIVTDPETSEIIRINLFLPETKLPDFDEGNW